MQTVEDFSARLDDAMKLRGVKQVDLAREMNTSQSTVSRWLAGAVPQPRTLESLARALRVRSAWLSSGLLPVETKAPYAVREEQSEYQIPDKDGKFHAELERLSMASLISTVRLLSLSPYDKDETLQWIFRRMEQLDASELNTTTK